MGNALASGRQFIYDRLKANESFLAGVSSHWFNRKPPQGTKPPFAFISALPMNIRAPLGTKRADGDGEFDIHLMIGRDDQLSTLEPLVTAATATLQTKAGATSKGVVSGCAVVKVFEVPLDVGSDEYMHQIIRVRLWADG